jgi:hypothetical protein
MSQKTITRMRKYSSDEFMGIFKSFKINKRLKIAREINRMLFSREWKKLDADLPDTKISDDEIMKEVKAVRYGKA